MEIAIVGGGICGLALAMNLRERGIAATVYERAPEIKELGVGITVLPHAMREFAALGLADEILRAGIENAESCFFNRFGQLIYKEPRGKLAGYAFPEVGIHRGRLHLILYKAAVARLGPERIKTDHTFVGFEQDARGASVRFVETSTSRTLEPVRADAVIACDGVNSAIRKMFYPNDAVAFSGINTWRGVTRRKPILSGRSYMRVGSILTGKIVIYPIIDDVDREGHQLINWMAEIKQTTFHRNDWNQAGNLADFYPIYQDWRFDWLDVAALIRDADFVLEYPMVDKDPIDRWSFGRLTLAGDAAHPMYPRGSNGAAQAAIDARTLADCLAAERDAPKALAAYEAARAAVAAKIVRTNREHPPDFINIRVEELVGDRPFDDLDRYITQDELRALSENYKKIAGFSLEAGGRG
jgi:2-polyprenyl-6-methoxyphenol hydroxylase-like FAD-dependent oxidoreductase